MRYQNMLRPHRQRQFLIGRALLRSALAPLVQRHPAEITLIDRSGLGPVLIGDSQTGFSLSHSGPWIGCVVCADVALGLDIERRTIPREFAALAEQICDADTAQQLASLPSAAQAEFFYAVWSRREARIKLRSNARVGFDQQMDVVDTALAHPELAIAVSSFTEVRVQLIIDAWPTSTVTAR